MSEIDGGPAFPGEQGYTEQGWNQTWEPGLSVRDFFAGQALAGILSRATTEPTAKLIAQGAYRLADAMIAARKKAQGGTDGR